MYQKSYSIPRAGGKRAIPDVSYAADPDYGFSVYHGKAWYVVGGTSAGAPQWAAIEALGHSTVGHPWTSPMTDKSSVVRHRLILPRRRERKTNGDCAYYCAARERYDYVTGLGSPLTYKFYSISLKALILSSVGGWVMKSLAKLAGPRRKDWK